MQSIRSQGQGTERKLWRTQGHQQWTCLSNSVEQKSGKIGSLYRFAQLNMTIDTAEEGEREALRHVWAMFPKEKWIDWKGLVKISGIWLINYFIVFVFYVWAILCTYDYICVEVCLKSRPKGNEIPASKLHPRAKLHKPAMISCFTTLFLIFPLLSALSPLLSLSHLPLL